VSRRVFLLRYHEIALKGANRKWFENRLAINARKLLERELGKNHEAHDLIMEQLRGRIVIRADFTDAETTAAVTALKRLFGMSSFSEMIPVKTDLALITSAAKREALRWFDAHGTPRTFRVFTRRSDKALPLTSMEIDREVGGRIKLEHPSLTVDLDNPDFTLGIELRDGESFIWTQKHPGPGGLPVGTSGHLLCLLSGGIDSPVAAIMALKRGATVSFVHFDGQPFTGPEATDKVQELAKAINRFQPNPQPVHVVPFGRIQEKIASVTNPRMRTLLYRRMMMRIASRIAWREKARCLLTGESLGQVASQTLDNIIAVDEAAGVPVLRPLLAFDKDEIIERAEKFGTFAISIQPATDCCTLFADKHPSINSNLDSLLEQEKLFPFDAMVSEALHSTL